MKPLRISAVSYLNTYPFVYGLKQSGKLKDFELTLEVPSVCASRLKNGEADIALVPAGAISDFDYVSFVSDYCIGASGEVRTVLLLSQKPISEIKKIHLDPDSRTSVLLAKVLASKFWKIEPEWVPIRSWDEQPDDVEAMVAIGDKTFSIRNRFAFHYDLATEWIRHTSTHFVFAAWLAVNRPDEKILKDFNKALEFGVSNRKETLEYFRDKLPTTMEDARVYLEENISYDFDLKKKKGLELFLELSRDIN